MLRYTDAVCLVQLLSSALLLLQIFMQTGIILVGNPFRNSFSPGPRNQWEVDRKKCDYLHMSSRPGKVAYFALRTLFFLNVGEK